MEEEKQLVIALKKGSRSAFGQLFRLYHKQLFSFCYSIIQNKEEAENLTQDVFIKLWIKRAKIDIDKSFSGFLFTIARNMTLNQIRSIVQRQIIIQQHFKKKITSSNNSTEEQISFNEVKHILGELIDHLPQKRKEIFLLSREKELSHKEIAELLGISIHTVENQIYKATKTLQKKLNQLFPFVFLMILLI